MRTKWEVRIILAALVISVSSAPLGFTTARAATHPALVYSSFLGGGGVYYNQETAWAVAVDTNANAYVVGATRSAGFPVTAGPASSTGAPNGFLAKLAGGDNHLIYSILIPGTYPTAVAVDAAQNVYLAGYVDAGGLTTTNAAQAAPGGNKDAFVAKVSADGARLLYLTYWGGAGLDLASAIAVDGAGNAYITGWTTSTNFPVSGAAPQKTLAGSFDAFAASFDATGQRRFSTYLGGKGADHGSGIALDSQGSVYITGTSSSTNFLAAATARTLGGAKSAGSASRAFVAKLSGDGSTVTYLTLVGGSGSDRGAAIAVDGLGSAFILGDTTSSDFPVTTNAVQTMRRGDEGNRNDFVAKLNPAGDGLVYATYFGGTGSEALDDLVYAQSVSLDGGPAGDLNLPVERGGIALDAEGDAYVGSRSASSDLSPADAPATVNALGLSGFVAKLNPDATALLWFRYLTGSVIEAVALSPSGLWAVGTTPFVANPPELPVTMNAYQPQFGGDVSDAFIARLAEPPAVPGNDNFAARAAVTGAFVTVEGDNTGATLEPGEPKHGGGHSIWWSWQAPASGRLIATTQGTGFETQLAAYTGDTVATLTTLATNDLAAPGKTFSRVEFPVTAGTEYKIAVDGANGVTGVVDLTLMFSTPTNDDFSHHATLTGFPVTAKGSSVGATPELGEVSVFYDRSSVWWEWTAPFTGNVSIDTAGSDFATVLCVYTNAPANTYPLTSDHSVDGLTVPQVSVAVQSGVTYYISVAGEFIVTGNIQLNIGKGAPPPNDNFTNATVLSGPSVAASGSNVNATIEPGEPVPNPSYPANQTVWWDWTAVGDGYALISTLGSSFDTRLAIFTGASLTNLTLVAANDNWQGITSQVYFPVLSNTTYHVAVDGYYYSPEGSIQLAIQFKVPSTITPQSVARTPGGGLRFSVLSPSGKTPQIETSTNLIDWVTLPGTVAPDGTFIDTTTAPGDTRFYRAVTGP